MYDEKHAWLSCKHFPQNLFNKKVVAIEHILFTNYHAKATFFFDDLEIDNMKIKVKILADSPVVTLILLPQRSLENFRELLVNRSSLVFVPDNLYRDSPNYIKEL
jgi:hypothetical protein